MSQPLRDDYYRILGVPRSATAQEIGSAYRALAIKYHPDTSHGELNAGAKFKRTAEAYEVLSDPEKRRRYDRQLQAPMTRTAPIFADCGLAVHNVARRPFDWINIADFMHAVMCSNEPDVQLMPSIVESPQTLIRADLPVTPEEARYGATVPLVLTIRQECPLCSGSGRGCIESCAQCDGNGVVAQRQSLSVTLPRGTREGSVLMYRGSSGLSSPYNVELQIQIRPWW
jgi:molecular chaperone DnaJ